MDDYSKALRTALERRRRAGRRADVFGVLDMASTKDLLRRTIRRVRGRGSRQRSSKPDSSAEGSRVVSSPGAPNTSGLRWAGCASLFHSALTEEREMPVIQFQTPAVALLTVGDGPGVGEAGGMLAGTRQEHMPGGALHDQPGPPRVAVTRLEVICLGKSASGEMGIHDVHINSFSALPSHFEAKKGLLSRFRQVVAPLRRVVLALRRALAALRPVLFHGFDALQRLPEPVMSGRDSLACALFGK